MAVVSSRPRGVHLVGSVPLGSADEVFRTVSAALGDRLRRLPDGETGDRARWVGWQMPAFARLPELEQVSPEPGDYPPVPRFRLRPDASASSLQFGDLGYAAAALASYADFARLKQDGAIPAHCRFQVSIATPLAPVIVLLDRTSKLAVEPAYEAAVLGELDRIVDGIPHDQLAIQWDVCIEVWLWEGWLPAPFPDVPRGITERLARISAAVPADVELGYHLCYGDHQHQHFHEPRDLGTCVEIGNAIATAVARPIQWVHMPVPIERDDAAYFAPLRELHLHPETRLYLGLVHIRDGEAGARRRVTAAQQVVSGFGVATECGMGRRPPDRGGGVETFPELLRIHAAVSEPVV